MELFGIPGTVLLQGGAVAILALAVLLIFSGKIVPRKTLEDVRADRDARLKEAHDATATEKARGDEWRAAYLAEAERNDLVTRQQDLLVDSLRTTNALIEGLKQASEKRR